MLEKFSQLFAPSFPFERPEWKPGHKIKVGFLVTPGHEGGFLRRNEGLMNLLNPKRFEVYLFCNGTTQERLAKYHPDFDLYLKEILESDTAGHILMLMGTDSILSRRNLLFEIPQCITDWEALLQQITYDH